MLRVVIVLLRRMLLLYLVIHLIRSLPRTHAVAVGMKDEESQAGKDTQCDEDGGGEQYLVVDFIEGDL